MQQRALVRTRDLAGFRDALVDRATAGDPLSARRRIVIVPTRAAAELFRQTLEAHTRRSGRAAVLLPDLVTREDLVARFQSWLPGAPPLLTRVEREVVLEQAARASAARGRMGGSPFGLRPGLIASMLDFYDELRRRERTVRRFGRAVLDQLRVERGTDRGSEGLIHQTCFLAFAFLAYERAVETSGRLDEHILWRRLVAAQPALPFDHVVVAVADHPSDPRGLWPADFNLIGRLRGVRQLDVVVTDETHDVGFRDRIEHDLPGIDEEPWGRAAADSPILLRPAQPEALCFVARDREEELRAVARDIRARLSDDARGAETMAIVFHRPLPYLYLAHQILADASIPYQTFDALPLGAEPFAAALDLVLAVARTGGTREASVSLLRSHLLRFEVNGQPVGRRDAAALDSVLAERRAAGDAGTYPAEIDAFFGAHQTRDRIEAVRARRGAAAAAIVSEKLRPFRSAGTASARIETLAAFLRECSVTDTTADAFGERQDRARAAVLGVLDGSGGRVSPARRPAARRRGPCRAPSITRSRAARSRRDGVAPACNWSTPSPRGSPKSITRTSWGSSSRTGRSGRGGASSTRAAFSRRSGGRRSLTRRAQNRRRSATFFAWPAPACNCTPSNSTVTPSSASRR